MIDTLNRRRHARQQAVDAVAMRVELAEGVEHDQVGAGEGVGEQPGTFQPPTMFPEYGSGLGPDHLPTRPALSAGLFFLALMSVRAAPALRSHAIVAKGTECQGTLLEWHQS